MFHCELKIIYEDFYLYPICGTDTKASLSQPDLNQRFSWLVSVVMIVIPEPYDSIDEHSFTPVSTIEKHHKISLSMFVFCNGVCDGHRREREDLHDNG